MNDNEFSEGDKLIREFMEHDEMAFKLPYHSSLDFSMLVVSKITSLGWVFQLSSYKYSNDAKFTNAGSGQVVQNVAWSTPLLAVYNLVVDFIKLYNQNVK